MKIKELYSKDEKITFESYANKFGVKDIKEYINPSGKYIDDCMLYKNILEAIQMFKYHYLIKDDVYILSDSGDTDGVTSAIILYQYMKELNEDWDIEILLHKGKERGLQDDLLFEKVMNKPKGLIIIPDSGTNDGKRVKEIYDNTNMNVLVLDHHSVIQNEVIKQGVLISNQINDNTSKNGSGCLVTHKFLQALDIEFDKNLSGKYIDMVALSLVSDSCNMSEMENREYYYYGLSNKNCINNKFLFTLVDKFCEKEYTQKDLSFNVIPKLNSICRSDNMELKQNMYLAFLGYNIDETIIECEKAHKNQQLLVKKVVENNKDEIEVQKDNNIVVLYNKDIPRSYSGLIASKAMGLSGNKPCIVGKEKDGIIIGSLRSNNPLREMLNESEYVEWASGHEGQCGICIKTENVNNFVEWFNSLDNIPEPCIEVLKSYTTKSIPKSLWKEFEPYKMLWGKGIENPTVHIKFTYEPSKVDFLDRYGVFLNYYDNGINIKWDYIDKQKKVDMKLGYIDNSIGRDKFIRKDDKKKYRMNVIGTIEDNYTIKADKWWIEDYKSNGINDLF